MEGRDRRLRGSAERRRIGSSGAVRRSTGRSGARLAGRIRPPAGARRSRPASQIRSRQLLVRCRLVPSHGLSHSSHTGWATGSLCTIVD